MKYGEDYLKERGYKMAMPRLKASAIAMFYKKNCASAFYIKGLVDDKAFFKFREMANKIYGNQWKMYFNSGTAGMRNRHGWTGRVD